MTTSSVIFTNPGLIDIRAVKTFGVNVKESDNPFGYFGTGLKYAIAILLRNRCQIVIHRGLDRTGQRQSYNFAFKETIIRGKEFSIVTMNGEELGFTSELGKNWELWQAYRELYCNTMDESGEVYTSAEREPVAEKNTTTIVVTGEAFLNTHHRRREFILQSDPIETSNEVEIHQLIISNNAKGLFYKNISIGDMPKPSKFTYNILSETKLTEDRTVASLWSANWEIERALVTSSNEKIIEQAVLAEDNFVESDFNYHHTCTKPSETFMQVLGEIYKNKALNPNHTAVKLYLDHNKENIEPTPAELSAVQEKQLKNAVDFCTKLKLYIPNEFPIIVVETLGTGILGQAKKRTIYLSVETFDMGTKMVAGTLIEEYIHLKHHYQDMTRSMQNHLFNKIITLGEEINGEPL